MDVAAWPNGDGRSRVHGRVPVPVPNGGKNHDAATARCRVRHEPPDGRPRSAARGDAPVGDARHFDDRRCHSGSRRRQGRADIRSGVAPDANRDRRGRMLESSLRKCTMGTMGENARDVSCKDTEDFRKARVCGLAPAGKIARPGLTPSTRALHFGAGHPERDSDVGDPESPEVRGETHPSTPARGRTARSTAGIRPVRRGCCRTDRGIP